MKKTPVKGHTRKLPSGRKTNVRPHFRTLTYDKRPGINVDDLINEFEILTQVEPFRMPAFLSTVNEYNIDISDIIKIESDKETITFYVSEDGEESYEVTIWEGWYAYRTAIWYIFDEKYLDGYDDRGYGHMEEWLEDEEDLKIKLLERIYMDEFDEDLERYKIHEYTEMINEDPLKFAMMYGYFSYDPDLIEAHFNVEDYFMYNMEPRVGQDVISIDDGMWYASISGLWIPNEHVTGEN